MAKKPKKVDQRTRDIVGAVVKTLLDAGEVPVLIISADPKGRAVVTVSPGADRGVVRALLVEALAQTSEEKAPDGILAPVPDEES